MLAQQQQLGVGGSPSQRTSPSSPSAQRNSSASVGISMRRASRSALGIVAMPENDAGMVFEEPPATEMEALLAEVGNGIDLNRRSRA